MGVKSVLALASPSSPHQAQTASRLAVGMARHGVKCEVSNWMALQGRPLAADAYVCWGWRKGKALRHWTGKPVLVMERGYIGDRFRWTSLGWNGLNGRAIANDDADPERLRKLFPAALAAEWKQDRAGPAVIMGQVQGDAALENCAFPVWVAEASRAIERLGLEPRFRTHPVSLQRGHSVVLPARVRRLGGELADALAQASLVVTWNSNAGVDAALAGVPVIACDQGSMAWDVAGHGLAADPFGALCSPAARERWAARLSWRQWSQEEIASGEAWERIGKVNLDGALSADAARG